jgi:hypothetical protein
MNTPLPSFSVPVGALTAALPAIVASLLNLMDRFVKKARSQAHCPGTVVVVGAAVDDVVDVEVLDDELLGDVLLEDVGGVAQPCTRKSTPSAWSCEVPVMIWMTYEPPPGTTIVQPPGSPIGVTP